MQGSSEHEKFLTAVDNGVGNPKILTQINIKDILRPAVQLGAEIDYQWPDDLAYVQIDGADHVEVVDHAHGDAR